MNVKSFAAMALVLSTLALAPAHGASASVGVSMDKATYSALDTLVAGAAPVATIVVVDAQGAPVAGAAVTVSFLRQVSGVGFVSSEVVSGTTDGNGVFLATAPQLSGAPGSYMVVASALGTNGSASYTVGA